MDFSSPIWADVTPLEQDDGSSPLVPIAYDDSYRLMMGYFRQLVANKELSQRALDLTTEILQENASHCIHSIT
jgi:protein farnesyltransferase/geranylgeranyltransferase type-1 subunit alpha